MQNVKAAVLGLALVVAAGSVRMAGAQSANPSTITPKERRELRRDHREVRNDRQEVNGDGIRVLSIFPGRTDTPMQREILAKERRTAPYGTLLRPEDVASMVIAALKIGSKSCRT